MQGGGRDSFFFFDFDQTLHSDQVSRELSFMGEEEHMLCTMF